MYRCFDWSGVYVVMVWRHVFNLGWKNAKCECPALGDIIIDIAYSLRIIGVGRYQCKGWVWAAAL